MPAPPERRSAGLSRTGRSAATWCVISVRAPGTRLDNWRRDEFPERARRCCICWGAWKEGVMRDGIFIVDGDGHVMDFPHRWYQEYLPEQYRRRIAFFPGAQWDRRQAPNGDLGRDPNTPQEMMADMALRIGEIREADYHRRLVQGRPPARGLAPRSPGGHARFGQRDGRPLPLQQFPGRAH